MSCNGCRVLRKGCSDGCVLRPCLQWLDTPQAQANATLFVAKFFGRAGLMSFISNVPEDRRPALFQSLLFEACGRTVNPVNGAVGLLSTGNWHVCQSAVDKVLRGEPFLPAPEFEGGVAVTEFDVDFMKTSKRKGLNDARRFQPSDLDLCLTTGLPARRSSGGKMKIRTEKRRPATPSLNSEESGTTSSENDWEDDRLGGGERKLLRLFS